ncbi:MAG TPA: hypothetical protein V6C58_23705, partial [Allocoleopsis sp.]
MSIIKLSDYSYDTETKEYTAIKLTKFDTEHFFFCSLNNIRISVKKAVKAKGYQVFFTNVSKEMQHFALTLKDATQWIIGELNKPILARYAEKLAKEEAEKLAKEEANRIQAELDAAIIAEVKATVKIGYTITNCDNENLLVQLNKLLSQLSDKYQSKLGLPVVKEDHYGFYQDFSNFSVVELENGLCEFTVFVGTDIIQFVFNGHSSINFHIVNEIDIAINNYIKTGKIAKKSGKKPALKLVDKHNKSAKRSKEAIALAALAKELKSTYTVKPTERSPLERMVSDMV